MREFKKLLVAVDFSSCSLAALEQALALAAQLGAAVDVLHVAEYPDLRSEPRLTSEQGVMSLREYALQEGRAELDAFLTGLTRELRTKIGVFVDAGRPRDRILARAREGYDLLVMGTNGRTGRAHSLAGSVTESIVRMAPCPVLAIREGE